MRTDLLALAGLCILFRAVPLCAPVPTEPGAVVVDVVVQAVDETPLDGDDNLRLLVLGSEEVYPLLPTVDLACGRALLTLDGGRVTVVEKPDANVNHP